MVWVSAGLVRALLRIALLLVVGRRMLLLILHRVVAVGVVAWRRMR